MLMMGKITIGLQQFQIGQHHVVSFETFRGFLDMLRYCGQLSVDFKGGDEFVLNVNPRTASDTIARFASFGIRATEEEAN